MFLKIIVITIGLYFAIVCKCQENSLKSGQRGILLSSVFDYEYESNLKNNPTNSDLNAVKLEKKTNHIRKRRNLQTTIRGDQGPPPDDFDYYSNIIDEEPTRGDLGGNSFNLHHGQIGGSTVDITRFPYQVSITHYNNVTDQWEHTCGGSILSQNIVITAAHCTYGISIKVVRKLRIRVGSSSSISGGKLIKIKQIINHEHYNRWNSDNDIAIIVLIEKIKFTKKINKIEIASKCRPSGTIAIVSGWGYLEENTNIPSPNLNFINVPVIEQNQCQNAYKGLQDLTSSMICAGYLNGGKDSCATDLGGPLAENGELIGIVSWGLGCDYKNKPGVYTDVFYMGQWIIDKIKIYSN